MWYFSENIALFSTRQILKCQVALKNGPCWSVTWTSRPMIAFGIANTCRYGPSAAWYQEHDFCKYITHFWQICDSNIFPEICFELLKMHRGKSTSPLVWRVLKYAWTTLPFSDDGHDDGHLLSDACWTMTRWWRWWWWSPRLTWVEICTRFADSLDKVDTNEKSKHNSNTEQITNFLSSQLELNTGLELSGNLAASAGVAQVEICTKACSFYWESLHTLKEQTE